MKDKIIERDWLFVQIWQRPATKIAADLGISSSALKKICDAMGIPTPGVGHWQKVEYGKKVRVPTLPPVTDSIKTSWKIDHNNSKSQKSQKQRGTQIREAIAQLPDVTLSTDMDNLHSLVTSTRAQIRENAKNLAWDKRKNRRRLNVKVSEAALDRTSLLLDTFIKGCEALGYEWKCELDTHKPKKNTSPYPERDEPSGICWIEAEGEQIEFWLREKTQRIYLPEEKQSWYKKYDDVPCGMLECGLGGAYHRGGRTNWRDGKIQKVEKLLPLMIAEIPVIAKARKEARDQQARRERRWQYERELWNFDYHRNELREGALKKFIKHASEHQSANVARQYVEAVKEKLCSKSSTDTSNDKMQAWLNWADQAVAAMDPVQHTSPPWERRSFVAMLENLSLEPPSPPSDCDEDS